MIKVCNYLFKNGSPNLSTLSSRLMATQSTASDEFLFVSPIPEDQDNKVIVHLRNNFFVDEPLFKSVSFCKKGESHKDLETMYFDVLKERLSVMAVDKATDNLASVSLNGVFQPGDIVKKSTFLETVDCEKLKLVFSFLNTVNKPLHLFHKFDVLEIFDVIAISTDTNFRGKSLSKKVLKLSQDVARMNGFKLMRADATGAFSQNIFTSAGFETVYELKYIDYLNKDGQQTFKTSPPHDSFKVMVKTLK